jgi:hypothetical protein
MSQMANLFDLKCSFPNVSNSEFVPDLRNDHRMDNRAYLKFLDEAENGCRDSGQVVDAA